MGVNRQITLAARPSGYPQESDFTLVESPIPEPSEGEVLVRVHYLSVDPYMRGRMNDAKSYAKPVQIGEVMGGGAVGRILSSRHPDLREGDYVEGLLGWQEYAVSKGKHLRKLDPELAPVSTALGVLGMPGMTAYFGLLEIGQPKPGETVLVSGAAGAVGSLVGQIAKIRGCRAVGIAGSDRKVAHLLGDLGFDAAFDYKASKDYFASIRDACPDGIDVYFDNVGGAITDAVFRLLNTFARVAVCGQIALYNLEKPDTGPRLLPHLLVRQARAQGFLVFQFAERYSEGIRQMAQWLKEGRLKYREDIVEGFENVPSAFIGMLKGDNLGKRLVRISS